MMQIHPQIQQRILGRTGLSISEIGYGAWGIGGKQWGTGSDDDSLHALRRAFELGVNFVDTAAAYGDGHSERLIGQAIRDAPIRIILASKIPPLNRTWPAPAEAVLQDVFPASHIIECTENSLRNLQVDTIDLQQLHVWNPRWTQQDEWRRAFEDLHRAGKVRFIGVSLTEHDADSGVELAASGLVDALQVLYNIFDPTAAERLFPAAEKHGIGILARVPLDEGGLTGTIHEQSDLSADEFRAWYFRGDRKIQVAQRAQALQKDVGGIALPEAALRFCLSSPVVTSVIPGMRKMRHVTSNASASLAGPLPPEVLKTLRAHRWPRNFYT